MKNIETIDTITNSRVKQFETSGENKMKNTKQLLAAALFAGVLVMASSSANAVVDVGNPFTPTGADFSIFALQGIDSSHSMGASGFSPQVNQDFEFTPSIGVAYDTGGGVLKDFGLGLYTAGGSTESTGLKIQYTGLVDAASVTITVEDFDISSKDTFFKTGKVEPSILLLGPGGTVYGSAKPVDIFPLLTPSSSAAGKKGGSDVWDVSFAKLLAALHLADAPISGFILYADSTGGEIPGSDPYLLVSVGSGIPVVPEPANYIAGFAAVAFALLFHAKQVLKRKVS
jgi:hypothetical protein